MPDWKTFDAWEDEGSPDPFEIDGARLVMCCPFFPEAYDCYLGDEHIGYLRIRYGHFYAVFPDVGGEKAYYDVTLDDSYGFFTPEDRVKHLPLAIKALKERHEQSK